MAAADAIWSRSSIEEKSDLAWVLGNNQRWYLCSKCPLCGNWTEYPGFAHPCVARNTWHLPIRRLDVVSVVPTSMEELTGALECHETDSELEA